MLLIGIEEPMQVNQMLHELNDGRLVVANSINDKVNRYSLVLIEGFKESLSRYMLELIDSRSDTAYWVFVWSLDVYHTPARIRWRSKRFQREKWKLIQNGSIIVATRRASLVEILKFEPDNYMPGDGRFLLLCLSLEKLLQLIELPELSDIWEIMSRFNAFVPSLSVYNCLEQLNGTLVYEVKTMTRDHPGLVVLSSERLDVHQISNEVINKILHIGENAEQVFKT